MERILESDRQEERKNIYFKRWSSSSVKLHFP